MIPFVQPSVPGHPNCMNAEHPVNDLDQMRNLIMNRQSYDEKSIEYHWYDFEHQNELILGLLMDATNEAEEGPGLSFTCLPAYQVNILRPDLHRINQNDCLHNCYPGKMDVYSQMLLHFLRRERSPEIIYKYEQRYQQAYLRYKERLVLNRTKTG